MSPACPFAAHSEAGQASCAVMPDLPPSGMGAMNKNTRSQRSSTTRNVSSSRLQQKSGTRNSFGGYTKVQTTSGSFRMRPTKGQ